VTLHLHHLTGCAPAPLAHYLKALGILRVLAEQRDPEARGYWQDEHFCLLSTLDRPALERFFLADYAPTPFVSPWNKGSGFYDPKDVGLVPIENSIANRFAVFRAGIAAGRAELEALAKADAEVRAVKDRTKVKKGMSTAAKAAAKALKDSPEHKRDLAVAEKRFKTLKGDLFTPFLRTWRGSHRAWMDAALVWLEEGRASWSSLLGTGGNDGRLDFTNNAMQRLGELFDLASETGAARDDANALLRLALWSDPADKLVDAAVGQFLPGDAGGANSTTGTAGDSLVNPWDFVLMLEGAVMFQPRASRRLDPVAVLRASAPFAMRSHVAGQPTPGRESAERGEQWMPLWERPTTAQALGALLGEGRIQLGRNLSHRPIDAARSVARVGVARGVTTFVRFGFLERNGQSNIAVPLGRIDVRGRPRARLVDELGPWLDRLQFQARAKSASSLLQQVEGTLGTAVFAALTHDDAARRWQAVLIAASEIEAVQATGAALRAGPIPPLGPDWVAACDDHSPEYRLALALGSAAASYDRFRRPIDAVRQHWLPLDRHGRFRQKDGRLAADPRVVAHGRDPILDCAGLVARRLIEASSHGQRRLPLVAAAGCGARLADLAALATARVDLARTVALARALMAVRWDRWRPSTAWTREDRSPIDDAWAALRLALLPFSVREGVSVPSDPAIVRTLMAGDAARAVELALRRLRAAGLRPPIYTGSVDPATARLWAATLAFPISHAVARELARRYELQPTEAA